MKYMKRVAFSAVVVIAVIGGTIFFVGHYLSSQEVAAASRVTTCSTVGRTHVVTIKGDKVLPDHTDGKLCDRMTIVNEDDMIRLIAFGPHEQHVAYDGITEEAISQNQNVSVTLNEVGTYHFHDHIHDEVKGDFTVTR